MLDMQRAGTKVAAGRRPPSSFTPVVQPYRNCASFSSVALCWRSKSLCTPAVFSIRLSPSFQPPNPPRPPRNFCRGPRDPSPGGDGNDYDYAVWLRLLRLLKKVCTAFAAIYLCTLPATIRVVLRYALNAPVYIFPRPPSARRSQRLEDYLKELAPELKMETVRVFTHKVEDGSPGFTMLAEDGLQEVFVAQELTKTASRVVIAHEVAHVIERHAEMLEWWRRWGVVGWWLMKRPWFGLRAEVACLFERRTAEWVVQCVNDGMETNVDNEMSWFVNGARRSMELDADRRALHMLQKAGWDLEIVLKEMESLIANEERPTHPRKADRLRFVRKIVNKVQQN